MSEEYVPLWSIVVVRNDEFPIQFRRWSYYEHMDLLHTIGTPGVTEIDLTIFIF